MYFKDHGVLCGSGWLLGSWWYLLIPWGLQICATGRFIHWGVKFRALCTLWSTLLTNHISRHFSWFWKEKKLANLQPYWQIRKHTSYTKRIFFLTWICSFLSRVFSFFNSGSFAFSFFPKWKNTSQRWCAKRSLKWHKTQCQLVATIIPKYLMFIS